jgi:chromosome segregation ATPase
MRKLLFVACLGAVLLTGCSDDQKKAANLAQMQQRDSLNRIIAQKDSQLDDIMGTMNEVEQGFKQINDAENRVSIAKDGEGANKRQVIKENIKFIADRMNQNKALIAKLRRQLGASGSKSKKLQKTIDDLTAQLEEKSKQLQALQEELDKKDIHISELDETINNLITTAGNLSAESEKKSETISTQDKQLNTAWFAYGTKKELKEQEIYVKGKILQGSFNKTYFTKIDIRGVKEIKLYSKGAKLLTSHPSSSYSLVANPDKQLTLKITNPQLFWSTSKYLVVMVK